MYWAVSNKCITFEKLTRYPAVMTDRRFSVSSEDLRLECMRRRYCDLLAQPEVFPSSENWEFIISNRMAGLGEGLYRKFLVAQLLDEDSRCDYHDLAIANFPRYLKVVDRQYALEIVYADALTAPDAFISLIVDCELFDCDHISALIDEGNIDIAAELLKAYQPEYDGDVVDGMQYLLNRFRNLPLLGAIELRSGLFRSERRYICPDGHSNPCDVEFCECEDCGKDIRGLTREHQAMITDFEKRIAVLRDMLD